MAIPFNPPEWLLRDYMSRKSTGEQIGDSALEAAKTYASVKNQQATLENQKMLLKLKQNEDIRAQQEAEIKQGTYAHEYAPGTLPGAAGAYNQYSPTDMGQQASPTMTGDAQLRSMLTQSGGPGTLGPSAGADVAEPAPGPRSPILDHWDSTRGQGIGLGQNPSLAKPPQNPQEQANLEFAQQNPLGLKGNQMTYDVTVAPDGTQHYIQRPIKGKTIVEKPQSGIAGISWDTATPQQKAMAQALYEGRARASDLGFRERGSMVALANEYATQSNLPPYKSYSGDVHAGMEKQMAFGKMGQSALALNTALGHTADAWKSYEKLQNTDINLLNIPLNKIGEYTNDPDIVGLGLNLNALQGELANVFKSGGATDQEIEHWSKYLNTNLTPKQYLGAVEKIDELLRSRSSALDYQQTSVLGDGNGRKLLSPKAESISETIHGGKLKESTTPPPAGGPPMITIQDSQGVRHQLPPGSLEAAKKRDPGLKVIQ